MGLAKLSIRVNASAAFAEAMGSAPPEGISNLRAWRQWYDGPHLVLAFQADQKTIDLFERVRA